MKHKELLRTLKFVLFSISAGLIEIIAFSLLNELTGWSYWPCYLIALILSVLWNFTLNRRYTFQSASNVPVAMLKVFAFYCVFTPVSTIAGSYLADTLHWNEYLVTALNMVCTTVSMSSGIPSIREKRRKKRTNVDFSFPYTAMTVL